MNLNASRLVSVILPVFNGEQYLTEALESVLGQDYRPLEVIVVDDGSTDRTAELCQPYIQSDMTRYHFQEHQGLAAARNAGIRLARGDVIAFIDADDLWVKGKLGAQMRVLESDPSIDIVLGRTRQFISPELSAAERAGLRIMRDEMLSQLQNSSLIRKSAYAKTGLYDEHHAFAQDMEWFMRAQEANLKIVALEQLVHMRRIHRTNQGRLNPQQGASTRLRILKAALDRRRAKPAKRE